MSNDRTNASSSLATSRPQPDLRFDLRWPFNGFSALDGRRRDKTIWYRKTGEAEELSDQNDLESGGSGFASGRVIRFPVRHGKQASKPHA